MCKDILRQLSTAMDTRLFVQLARRDGRHTRGFVLDIGPEFALIAFINQFRFEGFDCLRLRAIKDVLPDEDSHFTLAVLKGRGHVIPPRPPIDLGGSDRLLLSASNLFPLITIYCFPEDAADCTVGRVVDVGDPWFSLKEIDSEGRWRGTKQYRLADVWRIHVGGEYEDALYAVGGEPEGAKVTFGRA